MAYHYANDHQEGKRQDADEWQGRVINVLLYMQLIFDHRYLVLCFFLFSLEGSLPSFSRLSSTNSERQSTFYLLHKRTITKMHSNSI